MESPLPRMPTTISVTPQKCNISDTSFGSRSTETTPTKMTKPEANIQDLQNLFVEEVLSRLYAGYVPVTFARGRNLTLNYMPYGLPTSGFH